MASLLLPYRQRSTDLEDHSEEVEEELASHIGRCAASSSKWRNA